MRSAARRAFEVAVGDFNAEGVGELRAGQQRIGIDVRCDFANFHAANASLLASARKRKSRSTA